MSNAICSKNRQKRQGESQKGVANMRYVVVVQGRKEHELPSLEKLIVKLSGCLSLFERMEIDEIAKIVRVLIAHYENETDFTFVSGDYTFKLIAEKGE